MTQINQRNTVQRAGLYRLPQRSNRYTACMWSYYNMASMLHKGIAGGGGPDGDQQARDRDNRTISPLKSGQGEAGGVGVGARMDSMTAGGKREMASGDSRNKQWLVGGSGWQARWQGDGREVVVVRQWAFDGRDNGQW